jgi:hypothetical protein
VTFSLIKKSVLIYHSSPSLSSLSIRFQITHNLFFSTGQVYHLFQSIRYSLSFSLWRIYRCLVSVSLLTTSRRVNFSAYILSKNILTHIASCLISPLKNCPLQSCIAKGGEALSLLLILGLSFRWGERSSRPVRTLLPEKDPRYPLDRRLGGPQRWSEHRGYRKSPLPLQESEPRSFSL